MCVCVFHLLMVEVKEPAVVGVEAVEVREVS